MFYPGRSIFQFSDRPSRIETMRRMIFTRCGHRQQSVSYHGADNAISVVGSVCAATCAGDRWHLLHAAHQSSIRILDISSIRQNYHSPINDRILQIVSLRARQQMMGQARFARGLDSSNPHYGSVYYKSMDFNLKVFDS